MTQWELSQLYWLNREIREQKNRIARLDGAAAGRRIEGLPHLAGDGLRAFADTQRRRDEARLRACAAERDRLMRFIDAIPDAQMQDILSMRYVRRLSWQRIAFQIGETDESYPRRRHNAFLRKSEAAENAGRGAV